MLRLWSQQARLPAARCVLAATQHHLADDPTKPYDADKIARLTPDYDDIRDNNDVHHTTMDIREAGELGDVAKEGGVVAAASALAGDVVGAGRIACEIAAGGVQGVGKVAAAAAHRVADLASRARGTPSPPTSRTDQYKRMRKGGGAAHDQQDTAYEQWTQPGEPSIEDKYPRAVEAAKLQAERDQPTPELNRDLEEIATKQKGEYES